jgi:hypothetical protein
MIGAEVGQIGGVVDRGEGGIWGEVVDGPEVDRFDVPGVAAVGADARAIGEDVADVSPYSGAACLVASEGG